jgi:hypothetical protein
MARFSQQMLAGLLNPTYQKELTSAARGLGGAPGRMMTRQATQRSQAEIQELLKQHANNPAKLQQLANEYRAKGNTDAAQAFTTAATQATAKETAGQQRGLQGGLTAITQAAARGVPLQSDKKPDLSSAVSSVLAQGGTQADIMSAYNAGVDLAKGEKPEIIQGTPGSQFFKRDEDGNLVLQKTVPFKEDSSDKTIDRAFELAKTGKYTAVSIQDAVGADGSIDYSKLQEVVESEGRGSVGSNVEKRNNEISAESTKSSIGLARNRQLQQELVTTQKTTGILSDWRTSVLDVAGLRDAEEEAKTAFLRTRNTDIINSLPPGVASDTDVRIFSQGFPAANASSEEILKYLQAEERILAASSDMAMVADRHLASQINAGLDATMVGFEDKKQKYASIMQKARRDIEEKTANAQTEQEAIDIELEVIKQVSEVLGFVPKFYR